MAIVIAILSFGLVAIVGYWNGAPWMFNNLYGENIVLFFVGGTAGSLGILALTYMIGRYQWPIINTWLSTSGNKALESFYTDLSVGAP